MMWTGAAFRGSGPGRGECSAGRDDDDGIDSDPVSSGTREVVTIDADSGTELSDICSDDDAHNTANFKIHTMFTPTVMMNHVCSRYCENLMDGRSPIHSSQYR